MREEKYLTSESVQGASLPLESIDDVHGSDGLPLSVLGIGDCITDYILKEDLEDTASLFVNEPRYAFDSTTTSQTTNSWLGDTLDVIAQHLAMPLCASLSQSFSSFATASHDVAKVTKQNVCMDNFPKTLLIY